MPLHLSSSQRAKLRGLAKNLKPSVQIGKQGITDSVLKELDVALTRYELIKVRVISETRDERAALMDDIAVRTNACLCGSVGHTASYYRPSPEPKIDLCHE